MKKVTLIIAALAVIVQLIRLLPVNDGELFSAVMTGGVFYLASNFGWYNQKNRPTQNWREWFFKALKGTVFFLGIAMVFALYTHDNRVCIDSDPLFGGCHEYSDEPTDAEKSIPFSPVSEAILPLLLAIAYHAGSAAQRIDVNKVTKEDTP